MLRPPAHSHVKDAASGCKRISCIGINDFCFPDRVTVIRLCFTRCRSKGRERKGRNRPCRIGAANQQRRTKWICKRSSGFSLDDPGFVVGMIRFSFCGFRADRVEAGSHAGTPLSLELRRRESADGRDDAVDFDSPDSTKCGDSSGVPLGLVKVYLPDQNTRRRSPVRVYIPPSFTSGSLW
jgi:hypothetical protein